MQINLGGYSMIKLEDVSTIKMLENYPSSEQLDFKHDPIARALTYHYVRDYQQLEDFINEGNQYYDIEFFRNWLNLIKENIEQANEKGIITTQFTFDIAEKAGLNPKTIKTSDRKVFCRHLVINNPILGPSEQVARIRDLRIYDAKFLLSKVVAHDIETVGQNAFLATYPTFSCEDILRLVTAINFYEQQIVRQSQEPHKTGINLFRLNKDAKVKIIEQNIEDIIDYILETANVCVWGEVTPIQKQRLISSLRKRKTTDDKLLIGRLIQMISNYTTLDEIKSGVKTKTLDRFIVK